MMMAGSVWRISALDRDGHPVGSCDLAAGELTIGRDADRQLILPSASVSRRHARLYLDGGMQLCIVDEGSANGVIVDGVRITAPTYVNAATRIDLAEFRIAVEPLGGAAMPGARQPRPTPVPGTVPSGGPALPAMRLVAEGGPYDGRVYDLAAQELAVGRAVDNDIVLDDPSLSRKHAKLRRATADELEVEDLGSSNGTYVNGRKVGRGAVRPGDVLRFGELNFRVEGDTLQGTSAVTAEITPQQLYLLAGGAALTLIMLVVMLIVLVHKPKPVQAPARPGLARIQATADNHLRVGRDLMGQRKFGDAKTELDQALELDPANSEARRLVQLAAQVPLDEKTLLSAQADIAVGDRKGLESALHLLDETMVGTPGHDKLLAKLTAGLTRFGLLQCAGRAWADCAWALCRAYEVAPDDARPDASARDKLRDAEKKIRDKSYARCRAVP
jgi:pSer/pThr/pTyr-binding forkhead associated (FHA) protein